MSVNATNKLNTNEKMNIDEFNSITKDMDFSHKPTYEVPETFGHASIKGALEEDKWYWITPENSSKIIKPNDIFKRFEISEIYGEADPNATPIQFKKVDNIYLPYIELHYVTLSIEKLDYTRLKSLTEYIPLLDQQYIIYINDIPRTALNALFKNNQNNKSFY